MQADGVAASALGDIFAEEPPDLTTFITDAGYLSNPALSDPQFEVVRHAEQIFRPELYPAMVEAFGPQWMPVRYVNFIDAAVGKGGGKDHVCRMSVARASHLLTCLKSPQRYYGMPEQDSIHFLNVATSAPQAHRAFFVPLSKLVKAAKCFPDDDVNVLKYTIEFANGVEAVSGHSDADGMEGLNILMGIIDEVSAFRRQDPNSDQKDSRTAEALMEMVRSSANTRFPETFKRMAISYPRQIRNDIILNEVERDRADYEAKGEASTRFAMGPLATWEFHPMRTKDQFDLDYEEDPAGAMMRFECIPSHSSKPVFRNTDAVERSFFRPDPIDLNYYWDRFAKASKDFEIAGWEVMFEFVDSFRPEEACLYALHGDKAVSGDRAGVAMSHVSHYEQVETEAGVEDIAHVVVDFATAFTSDKGAEPLAREVQLRWYRELVAALRERGFVIRSATFDGFQSTDSIQQFTRWGIESKRVSTDLDPTIYETLRNVIYSGRLRGPTNPILITELEELTRLGNGKVDHPPGGSKDISDAVAGSVHGALITGGGVFLGGDGVDDFLVEHSVGGGFTRDDEMLEPMSEVVF